MSAPGNITGEIKARQRAVAFMGNLIAVLGLLVIGYPLAPATVRTTLLGWILIAVAITQYVSGHHFQTAGSSTTIRTVPAVHRGGQSCSGETDHECT